MATEHEHPSDGASESRDPRDTGGGKAFEPGPAGSPPEITNVVPSSNDRASKHLIRPRYNGRAWQRPRENPADPVITSGDNNRVSGALVHASGMNGSPDLGTYIAVEGTVLPGDAETEPKAQPGHFRISVVYLRAGHTDPDHPDTEPAILSHTETIGDGTYTTALGAISQARKYLALRDKEGLRMEREVTVPSRQDQDRNTLTPERLQAARQAKLDAIVVDDNEQDTQEPEYETSEYVVDGRVVGVQTISLGTQDPDDSTLSKHLEATTQTRPAVPYPELFADQLRYDIELVTVSQSRPSEGGEDVGIREDREPLLRGMPMQSTEAALRLGREAAAARESVVRRLGPTLEQEVRRLPDGTSDASGAPEMVDDTVVEPRELLQGNPLQDERSEGEDRPDSDRGM